MCSFPRPPHLEPAFPPTGGFGVVAEATWGSTPVAVKTLKNSGGAPGDAERRRRKFLAEVRLLAELRHPNLLQVNPARW